MNPSASPRLAGTAFLFSAVLAVTSVSAATIPYANSFDSSGFSSQSGFTRSSANGGTLTASVSGTNTLVAYGSEQFSNSVNTSYTLSTQFVVTALGTPNGDQAVGFGVFGLDATFTGNSVNTSWIQASYIFASNNSASAGQLRFVDVNGTSPAPSLATPVIVDTNGASAGVVTVGTVLTLKLDVLNTAANTYTLTLGLFDAAGTHQFGSLSLVGYQARTAPEGGYFMGIRDRIPNFSATANTTTLVHNNFSVIPEPSAFAALAGLGALGFVASRRRRA